MLIAALEDAAGVQLPLFVFVDELDRCRPDYAIELLEGIKHLFGVPGVYFVIATNVQQLGHSIKAVYGSEFDGQRYLKRFFDLQYALPEPSNNQFCRMLLKGIAIPELEYLVYGLEQQAEIQVDAATGQTSENVLVYVFSKHVEAFELGLRDQHQIANLLEAAFFTLQAKQVHIFFLVFLAVIYQQDQVVFHRIAKAKNLGVSTGFEELHKKNGKGLVRTVTEPEYNKPSQEKNTDLVQIANVYMKAIEMTVRQRSELNVSAIEFPGNLLRNLSAYLSRPMIRQVMMPQAR